MAVQLLQGDCRDVLKTLPDASVHCCVTSPPYWGLRDYGVDGQIGMEASVQTWVEEMVAVFREVRRVLRDEGTLWLNLGDSYAGSRGGGPKLSTMTASRRRDDEQIPRSDVRVPGLKPKDLVGQPWRVAFALQADGWYLRQDVIWSKVNPMPESVRDRCTKAHEYLFLLAKAERYYYDFAAMQEPVSGGANPRRPGNKRHKATDAFEAGDKYHRTKAGLVAYAERQRNRVKNNASMDDALAVMPESRNRRSVWHIASEPFSEAHFATFPPALIEPCILAGCPVGGTVLDPFMGAGTTGLVADRLQRNAIGIELNPAYIEIARRRIQGDAPLFADVGQQFAMGDV